MAIGYLALVLHAHLPFVRHPESDYVLEEEWLYEAIIETYIPLITMFEGLKRDGIDFKITMSMTPPLVSMLQDPLLQERFDEHLAMLEELTELEVERNVHNGHLRYLAEHYAQEFNHVRNRFGKATAAPGHRLQAIPRQQQPDIITCGATHGYLPLMKMYPEAVWAQIQVAAEHYEDTFGRPPSGIWLPECAYYEGLERMVADAGLRYFLTDGHGILYARPRPRFGSYAPIFTESGVAAFGRDHESSQQVWSSQVGYPGAPEYREFYRDLGWDAEYEYIKPYIMPNGQRKNVGIKYHKITGKGLGLSDKQLVRPLLGREKAADHAANFMYNREQQIGHLHGLMQRPPIVVSPYDAELFGHWWYEGPWFLDYLFRKTWFDQGTYEMTHLADYLQDNPTQQVCRPPNRAGAIRASTNTG
jgi:1,4-alpha-glucan branching enzyme